MESRMNFRVIHKTGPLFFKIMMTIITSNTEEAICKLNLKVSLHYFHSGRKHQHCDLSTMRSL